MIDARNQRIVMDGNGSYLGMSRGCFILRDSQGNEEKYPLFENQIKEVILQSGNSLSTGALASARASFMIRSEKSETVDILS